MKIAITWANPYNKNLGVGALAYSALTLLTDVFEELQIKPEITFFGSSKMSSDTLEINKKIYQFDNIIGLDLGNWKASVKMIFLQKRYRLNELSNFEMVFDVGEGDSFSDIYGEDRFNRILNSKKHFLKKNISQVLLPQTIGPFYDKKVKTEAFKTMQLLSSVMARDKKSFEYCKDYLPSDLISETVDMAFYMPFERTEKDNKKIKVGINVSGLLWNGGYLRNNQFNLKTDFKELIIKSIEFFSSIQDVEIYLVPHVIPENQPIEDDYETSLNVQEIFPNVKVAPRFNSPIEAKSFISGMDFFIGGRMHACIAAFGTKVPVVPLAYSRKFNGLFNESLGYKHMADCVNYELDYNIKTIIDGFNNRIQLKKEIESIHETEITPRLLEIKDILKRTILENGKS